MEGSIQNGETYGCTVEKVVFNPDLEYGLGEVETEIIDPFHFGFYPVDLNPQNMRKAEANLHYWPMSVLEARRRWPDFEGKIQSDDDYLKELGDDRTEISGGAGQVKGYLGTFGGIVKNFFGAAGTASEPMGKVLILEMWVKDYTEELGENDESVPKYPGYIRCITTCNGGKLVLDDRGNPSINPILPPELAMNTYLYDRFPFSLTPSIKDTNCAWAASDYEQLKGLNIEVDKALSQFTLLKDKAARLKIINPGTSGVSNKEFTNSPGILNPSTAFEGDGIKYMKPPEIPADILKSLDLYKDFFFLVSGAFELDQASRPGQNVIAYKAIAALIERAATMQRGKIRNYGKMIRERGRMFVSHVQNWYTEDRWISWDEDGEEKSKAINSKNYLYPVKLTVVSGSTMPRSKIQEREESMELFKGGAIDKQALLKSIEFPDYKGILKRMEAGPMGELFERLMGVGVPEELVQYFSQIAQLDGKEFKASLQKQEIPPFPQVLNQVIQGEGAGSPSGAPPNPLENAEVQSKAADAQLKMVQAQKVLAEIALIQEEIKSEQVSQQVKIYGVQFDDEKLRLEFIKTVASIEKGEGDVSIGAAKATADLVKSVNQSQGPYSERGGKSNNKGE